MNNSKYLAMAGAFLTCLVVGDVLPAAAAPRIYTYMHLDVFTETPLLGNQLAVYMKPQGLSAEQMFALTLEMAFSETTFVFPAEIPGTDFKVREFAPSGEVPIAGVPTIGTVFALAAAGKIKPGKPRVVLGLGAGPTDIMLQWDGKRLKTVFMRQAIPDFGRSIKNIQAAMAALSLSAQDGADAGFPLQEVGTTANPFLMVPLKSREAVDRAALDPSAFKAMMTQDSMKAGGVFILAVEPNANGATVYARFLSPSSPEGAATGIAAGPLGSYLVHNGLLTSEQGKKIVIQQGVKIHRHSDLLVNISVSGDKISDVLVGGSAVVVGEAKITVP
jgi:trans-2,3-dihydro-3-hydroxyanthranilate isomerase